jgi:hypothetical protein
MAVGEEQGVKRRGIAAAQRLLEGRQPGPGLPHQSFSGRERIRMGGGLSAPGIHGVLFFLLSTLNIPQFQAGGALFVKSRSIAIVMMVIQMLPAECAPAANQVCAELRSFEDSAD